MRVHHLDCGTLCPFGGRLVNDEGGFLERGLMVCHCLLIETDDGLVLVDSGLGLDDLRRPSARLGRWFDALVAPKLDPAVTAARQVARLGFRAEDVRHIVVTHLDLDHAGGLPDFPKAKVHVFEDEHVAAMRRPTIAERRRYRPAHWAHDPDWVVHRVDGERWFGFDAVHALDGKSSAEVLLVPLSGHSRGHCGIAVRGTNGWLLHAGDAYFFHQEMDPLAPRCPPGLAVFQRVAEIDAVSRHRNQGRLRALVRDRRDQVEVFCAHDAVELRRMQRLSGAT